MDTLNCDYNDLLTKYDINLAYVGNGLFAELRPIKHAVLLPPASRPDNTSVNATGSAPNPGTASVNLTVTESDDPALTTHRDESTNDSNIAESTTVEPILAGTTADNNTMREPVSTASHPLDNASAQSPGGQTDTLPSTTIQSTEPNLLSGTTGITADQEPTCVDTSQETIAVAMGSIKLDPTTIDILLSEDSSKSLSLSEIPNVPKDGPNPVSIPSALGYILLHPYPMNWCIYTFQKLRVHSRMCALT